MPCLFLWTPGKTERYFKGKKPYLKGISHQWRNYFKLLRVLVAFSCCDLRGFMHERERKACTQRVPNPNRRLLIQAFILPPLASWEASRTKRGKEKAWHHYGCVLTNCTFALVPWPVSHCAGVILTDAWFKWTSARISFCLLKLGTRIIMTDGAWKLRLDAAENVTNTHTHLGAWGKHCKPHFLCQETSSHPPAG